MPSDLTSYSHNFVTEEDQLADKAIQTLTRTFLGGFGIAGVTAVAQNAFILVGLNLDGPRAAALSLWRGAEFGIDANVALASCIGLVAVVAALAIAVVATDLQAPSVDVQHEAALSRAGRTFLFGARLSAAVTVTFSIMAAPDWAVVFLGFTLSLVATGVASGVSLRVDERRRAVRSLYRQQTIDDLEERIRALELKFSWVSSKGAHPASLWLVALAPFAVAVAAAGVAAILLGLLDILRQLVLVGALGAVPAVTASLFLALAVRARWNTGSFREGQFYLCVGILLTLVLSLPGLLIAIDNSRIVATVAAAPAAIQLILLSAGRLGRGAASAIWVLPRKRLIKQVEQFRAEGLAITTSLAPQSSDEAGDTAWSRKPAISVLLAGGAAALAVHSWLRSR